MTIRWKNPYLLLIITLLLATDVAGIIHGFNVHGRRDGTIAIVLPPYGIWRAMESFSHRTVDAGILAQTEEGRLQLVNELEIKAEVWSALLNLISSQKPPQYRTTMLEGTTTYNVLADVPSTGPITITVQSEEDASMTIAIISTDRDQKPDALKIVKLVNGQPEVHDTPIEKFSSDDASQFKLAWSLAWGTIAEELATKAK